MPSFMKMEEYYPAAVFLKSSYEKHKEEIVKRFPDLGDAFYNQFIQKIEGINNLEGKLKHTEALKKTTKELYAKANEMNTELNFVSYYFKQAKLDTAPITKLKKLLNNGNIEGATALLNNVLQYISENIKTLTALGMNSKVVATLTAMGKVLVEKNTLQNEKINALKDLHHDNKLHYNALYSDIVKLCDAGKIMYKGTYIADEFTITKIISRMRHG